MMNIGIASMKILIVDDNEDSRVLVDSLLTPLGYTVKCASNGLLALEMAKQDPPDLIISDIMMPGMNGFQFCRQIKQDGQLKNIPVVLFTVTFTETLDQKLAKEVGAARYIVKPTDSESFVNIINEVLNEFKITGLKTSKEPQLSKDEIDQLHYHSMAKKLERKVSELGRKNLDLEQLLYVTTHDLRTPLVTIEGFSKELQYSIEKLGSILKGSNGSYDTQKETKAIIEKEIPESIGYIASSTAKMRSLLTGLLNLSRLGQVLIQNRTIDMNSLLERLSIMFSARAREAGVNIEISDLPSCTGDESQLIQLFSNLIDNALNYIAPDRPGIIKITGRQEKHQSIYCIEDNGIGIAPKYHEKIFELFHQLNPAPNRIGIGLSLVKKILDIQQGDIKLESEPGKGSKFFVSLPK
jgi:signal transduction histidine kinase